MGAYLDNPITDKNPVQGKGEFCIWGACGMQGWRCNMEDAHISEEIKLKSGDMAAIFGVFDGHGGKEVAEFAKENFVKILTDNSDFKSGNFEKALT
jgi:protein phosphatase 1G